MQYSLVVPIYNDGALASDFCIAFEKVFKDFIKKETIKDEVELIFVNDGSPNNSIDFKHLTPLFCLIE